MDSPNKMSRQSSSDRLRKLETTIGLPNNFLELITSGNDWSIIIQLSALFEAALTYLIVERIGHADLENIISHLEMSGGSKRGKIAFAAKLGLLDDDDQKFLRALAELRNNLVHDIRQVNFDFNNYCNSLNEEQKIKFLKNFDFIGSNTPAKMQEEVQIFFTNPKKHFWEMSLSILELLQITIESVKMDHEKIKIDSRLADIYMQITG